MSEASPSIVRPVPAAEPRQHARSWTTLALVAGIAALGAPTLYGISQVAWASEQGAHGPIVLAIAIWLLARNWPTMRAAAAPGSVLLGGTAWSLLALAYLVARIVGSIVIESAMLYGLLVATLYLLVGWRAMRAAWFPILYFLFVLPPPGSFVAIATQPLRLEISQLAVTLLGWLGLPVARAGLLIYVDQYVLEVKAACGGLNSIISLSAIGLFYAYALHNANWRYCAVLGAAAVAFAILGNFVRVVILILVTYQFGDKAAQGFVHSFAGLTMFAVAMVALIGFDHVAAPLRRRLAR